MMIIMVMMQEQMILLMSGVFLPPMRMRKKIIMTLLNRNTTISNPKSPHDPPSRNMLLRTHVSNHVLIFPSSPQLELNRVDDQCTAILIAFRGENSTPKKRTANELK
mmetsp:Transcript_39106/g.43648  ORF Transcript_39106/g.43648 Transcript_39106/m.43648 type:complete len:107 (-) Transcript_39106:300-620(-)